MDQLEAMVVVATMASILVIFLWKRYFLYRYRAKGDMCHYKGWHGMYRDTETSRVAPEILARQNHEISEAFRYLQMSVDKLNYFSPQKVVSAEKILGYAFEVVTNKDTLNELVKSTIAREHSFVAASLKNAWQILAPEMDPGRTFVKHFCDNLQSNKCFFYSAIEEAHSCLECFEWTIVKIITLVEKKVTLTEKKKVMREMCSFFGEGTGLKSYSDDVKFKLLNILNKAGIKKTIALKTEMVGAGYKGCIDMVARVSLVDKKHCIYDKFVKPIRPVTDYRPYENSVEEVNLADAEELSKVQKEVADLIQGRILIGYDLDKELKVLNLKHPEEDIRDASVFPPFGKEQGRKPSLRMLSKKHLDRDIHSRDHCPVEGAKASRDLYLQFAKQWEQTVHNMGYKADGVLWPLHVYRHDKSRDIDAWKLLQYLKQEGHIFKDSAE